MISEKKEACKREDNWKKYPYLYNELKNITFECQCGKKYVSFPGLYLHFQRRHNQKISTKAEESDCKITRGPSGVNYRYFINAKQQPAYKKKSTAEMASQPDFLSETLEKFRRYFPSHLQDQHHNGKARDFFHIYDPYLCRFESFLRKKSKLLNREFQLEDAAKTPYYFNQFILELRFESPSVSSEQEACFLLMTLWKWMFSQNLTKLQVVYDHESQS